MKLFYCDEFVLPLPPGHRFPMEKYRMLREKLATCGLFEAGDFQVPPAATFAELVRAHAPDYVQRVEAGALVPAEIRAIGFPWSHEMVERSKRSSGATIAACRAALRDGVSANLAGGTHHAFYDRGEGFCVFNDAAIAARAVQAGSHANRDVRDDRVRRIERVLIVDCDVHQGNGTASILSGDDSIFTFSIHGAKNYPFRREAPSDLDIDLPDGTRDDEYLSALAAGLADSFARSRPQLVIYLAGADPFEDDRLGRLKLSKNGLLQRDKAVFTACRKSGVPVAITMAGGYARNISDTVDVHFNTLRLAQAMFVVDVQRSVVNA